MNFSRLTTLSTKKQNDSLLVVFGQTASELLAFSSVSLFLLVCCLF
jgi:hypothetical protein